MISVNEQLNRDAEAKSSCITQNQSVQNIQLRSLKSESDFSKLNNILIKRMSSSL